MLTNKTLHELRLSAANSLKEDPFHIFYRTWRNEQEIVRHYLTAIQETYRFLCAEPFRLSLPDPPLIIIVVPPEEMAQDDLARDDPARNVSFYETQERVMVLPLRTNLPTREEERAWMTAAARHETTHAMCDRELDERLMTSPWRWVCEGFAAWVETQFPGSHYLTYAQTWCDYPQRPLGYATYDAFPFIAYFLDQIGFSAFSDLWANYQNSEPWDAILKIAGAAGLDPQMFFANYCVESYVPRPDSPVTAAIHERYGPRKAQEVAPPGFSGRLQPLACRYYTITPPAKGGAVWVQGDGPEWERLNLTLAQVLPHARLGQPFHVPKHSTVDAHFPFDTSEAILIVVSNGTPQRQRFSLKVQLV